MITFTTPTSKILFYHFQLCQTDSICWNIPWESVRQSKYFLSISSLCHFSFPRNFPAKILTLRPPERILVAYHKINFDTKDKYTSKFGEMHVATFSSQFSGLSIGSSTALKSKATCDTFTLTHAKNRSPMAIYTSILCYLGKRPKKYLFMPKKNTF